VAEPSCGSPAIFHETHATRLTEMLTRGKPVDYTQVVRGGGESAKSTGLAIASLELMVLRPLQEVVACIRTCKLSMGT